MKNKILLTIFTICFVASLVLVTIPIEQACGLGESGCSAVANSQYSKTFGISNSLLGVIAFLILMTLTLSHMNNPKKHKEIFQKTIIIPMAITALYFIFLQLFVLKAICPYCMIVDTGILISTIIIFYDEKWHKKFSNKAQKQ